MVVVGCRGSGGGTRGGRVVVVVDASRLLLKLIKINKKLIFKEKKEAPEGLPSSLSSSLFKVVVVTVEVVVTQ